jgi:hypothetical protein
MSRTDHHPVGARARREARADRDARRYNLRPGLNPRQSVTEQLAVLLDENAPARRRTISQQRKSANRRSAEAKEAKRRNEWIKSATREAERREADKRRPAAPKPAPIPAPVEPGSIRWGSSQPALPPRERLNCERTRVHELAREVGISSRDMVELLRTQFQEYVTCAQATVVAPVAREVLKHFALSE